jgi:photosystem II stability/assembly factor-like uncharacterized protein
MSDFTPAKTGLSRVFLIEGRARPDHVPSYESCLRADSLSKPFGDVERIECPDPNRPGKYIEVGTIQAGEERATLTLEGRYALDLKSELLRLARKGCALDVSLHFGDCVDLSDFNNFSKILVLEDVNITTYDTEPLGSLQSSDEAAVNESVEISAKTVYEITPLSFAERAGDVVTNEVVDVVICDDVSCGDCEDESDGCQKIYAITLAAGGSPGTPPDVVFSVDGGATWAAHDIDSMSAEEDPDANACLGGNLVIVSNETGSLHYALLSEFESAVDPDFTEVTTGFVTGGEPNDIFSVSGKAFIVGDGGYIYATEDATAGVDVLDAGVAAATANLNSVHALSKLFAVAAGDAGTVVFTENGTQWTAAATEPVGVAVDINVIRAKTSREWWVGTSDGRLFYTLDQGTTWTEKSFSGSGSGAVHDLVIVTDTLFYMTHATTTPRGRLFASFNGGQSWTILPQGVGVLPLSDRFNALAACQFEPDLLVAVGLADNGTDGIIVVGNM